MSVLQLSRDQLSRLFGQDHESIRQIERLLTLLRSVDVINGKISNLQTGLTQANAELDTLTAELRALQASVSEIDSKIVTTKYGSFYDTTSQSAESIDVGKAITFDSTSESNGVSISAPASRISVTDSGLYNIQFSAQLDNTSGGNHLAHIWLRVNGVDVANSSSQVRLKGSDGELVAAWNFYQRLSAGDYFELVFSVSDTSVRISALPGSGGGPAIPSVILTVVNVIVF